MGIERFFPYALAVAVIIAGIFLLLLLRRITRLSSEVEALDAERRMLAAALSGSRDGVALWRADAIELPSSVTALLGVSGPVDAARLADCIRETEREKLLAALRDLRNSGKPFELTCRSADGKRWLLASGDRLSETGPPATAPIDRLSFCDVSGLANRAAISERARARLAEMLDLLPLPIWARRPDLTLEYCNAAFAKAVDATRQTVVEQGLELTGNRENAAGRALARKALSTRAAHSEQLHVVIGGDRRLLEITEQPASAGLAGYAVDLTRLEESKSELARHIRAHGEVLESLSTSIVIFGSDGRAKFHNNEYLKQFGLDEEFLDGEPTLSEVLEALRERRRIPEYADFPRYKREFSRRLMHLITPVEELMHLPDGSTTRMVASPHPFGGAIITYEDVTDSLRLERSYNTLIQVQRETLDHLYEGIAVFGSDGRLKLSNPAYARMWGLSDTDLTNEPHVSVIVEHIRHFFPSGPIWRRLQHRIVGRVADRDPRSGRMERTDGTVLDFASLPLPDGGCLYTYLDVTDSTRVERALRERNAALETADRLKSEFIANVSYELRTPLNAIIGFAEILNQGYFGKLTDRQQEYSAGILEASGRLLSLINDILDIATIEAGYLQLDLHPVDVRTLVSGVELLAGERARNRRVSLTVDCPGDVGAIIGDERRLKQALYNIVSNAIKFTPAGGSIAIQARRNLDTMTFQVIDTGIGIDPQDQATVFQKFVRISSQGRNSGAGLGLALVKKLIELHGGRVELQSTPGVGTKVTCQVPIAGPSEEMPKAA